MTLQVFLSRAAASPVVWGQFDCHLWLADWVREVTGRDPATAFRRRYTTPRGALRVLRREGGSEAIVERLAAAAGLPEIDPTSPTAGDIGLLPCEGPTGLEMIGGVFTGLRWAMLAYPAGIVAAPVSAARVWRVL